MKKFKILHVMYGVDSGGVEAVVYNYYEKIDKNCFHFDIVAQSTSGRDTSKDLFAAKFRAIGSKVFYIPPKREGFANCMKQFLKIIKEEKYDLIHIHMGHGSLPYVICAKCCRIKNIVVHTHIAFDKTGWSAQPTTRIMGAFLRCFNVHKAACSKEAATEAWPNENVYVLNNAVDVTAYLQDEEKRINIRKALHIENDTALCAVARFTRSKNHNLLVDIFYKYLSINPNSKLVLIGNGELQQEIEQKVQDMNLNEKVIFLGVRNDVPDLLQAMDAFVLPSSFEGFGIVYIEAQLAGLPTFAIEGAVPAAVKVSDNFKLIPQRATPTQWAEEIHKMVNQSQSKESIIETVREHGFDIQYEVKKLEKFYLDILEN